MTTNRAISADDMEEGWAVMIPKRDGVSLRSADRVLWGLSVRVDVERIAKAATKARHSTRRARATPSP